MDESLYNKNSIMVLSFISKNIDSEDLYGSKIAEELGINQSGTSTILKKFEKLGIIEQSKTIGKTIIYNASRDNQLFKYFRVFENILELQELKNNIKQYCKKIILYGSCSSGEDDVESDIDLFIVSDEKEKVRDAISNYTSDREINSNIVTTFELIDLEKSDKVYLNEVEKGIELWGGIID